MNFNQSAVNAMAATLTNAEKKTIEAIEAQATAMKKINDLVTQCGLNPSSSGAMYHRSGQAMRSLTEGMNYGVQFHIACQEWLEKYFPNQSPTNGDGGVVVQGGGGGKGGNIAVYSPQDGVSSDEDYEGEYSGTVS